MGHKILVGISGSGKSTWAHNWWKEDKLNRVILSRDKVRNLLFGYSDENIHEYYDLPEQYKLEERVSEVISELTYSTPAVEVLIDNTHLKMKYIEDSMFPFTHQKEIDLVVFNTPLEICIERDKKRERKVGEDIIRRQYQSFLNLKRELDIQCEHEIITINNFRYIHLKML